MLLCYFGNEGVESLSFNTNVMVVDEITKWTRTKKARRCF